MSVYGTDALLSTFRRFSRQRSIGEFAFPEGITTRQFSGLMGNGFTYFPPYDLRPPLSIGGSPSILRPSITQTRQYRNINLWSIDYALRPRLRIRLTLGGRTCPRKPWVFGEQNSHLLFRYSCLHGHLYAVHLRSHIGFNPHTTLFYHLTYVKSAASVPDLVPIIFGAESLDQ